jgi:hypothetical protein
VTAVEIHTGIVEDGEGRHIVLEVSHDAQDPKRTLILMSTRIAREVAFALMEESDRLDPPEWRKE